jgi:hypothetical protein
MPLDVLILGVIVIANAGMRMLVTQMQIARSLRSRRLTLGSLRYLRQWRSAR